MTPPPLRPARLLLRLAVLLLLVAASGAAAPPEKLETCDVVETAGDDQQIEAIEKWYETKLVEIFDKLEPIKTLREKAKFAHKLRLVIRSQSAQCFANIGYDVKLQFLVMEYANSGLIDVTSAGVWNTPTFRKLLDANLQEQRPTYIRYLNRAYAKILGTKESAKKVLFAWNCNRRAKYCTLELKRMEQL